MSVYQTKLNDDFSWPEPLSELPLKLNDEMIPKLDPEYIKFFNEVLNKEPTILETHKYPLSVTRAGGNTIPGQAPPKPVAKQYDIEIPRVYTKDSPISQNSPTIPARVFVPVVDSVPESGYPATIWFHGGGWVLGGINTENSYCTHLADNTKGVVITVDYRLAPEDPYPACVEDAFEALIHVMVKGKELFNIDNKKIAIAGSSAGGTQTAVLSHNYTHSKLREELNLPPLKFQMMVVPVTDNTATDETQISWKENFNTPQLPAKKMLWYRKIYLPDISRASEPESSPLFYPDESFKGLPPAFIAAGECDVLRSEAEAYHQKLLKNGIKSKLVIYKGMPHTAMVMNDRLEQGAKLVHDTTHSIKEAFSS